MLALSYSLRQLRHKWYRLTRSKKKKYINNSPIIVTGNQKSGTSAIVSLLGIATSKAFMVDVFFRMGLYERNILEGSKSIKDFLSDADVYMDSEIVKEPEFIFFLDEIRLELPDSSFVFIVRDPFSNIRSILNRLNMTAEEAQEIIELKKTILPENPLWDLLFDKNLIPYGGDNFFEILVQRWIYVLRKIDSFSSERDIVVRYEDFQVDKLSFIYKLAADLGLSVNSDISSMLDINFQPKGTPKSKENFYSQKQIDYIYSNCGEEMNRYGYE